MQRRIYVVKAKPKRISWQISGKMSRLKPFEEELHHGLENARMIEGYVYWVEEDYCSPPLAMERRRSVLDRYFDVIHRRSS